MVTFCMPQWNCGAGLNTVLGAFLEGRHTVKEKSVLDGVSEMTAEEFDALSDAKKLEWFKEFLEELGKHGVLSVPSPELQWRWGTSNTRKENTLTVEDAAVRLMEPTEEPD